MTLMWMQFGFRWPEENWKSELEKRVSSTRLADCPKISQKTPANQRGLRLLSTLRKFLSIYYALGGADQLGNVDGLTGGVIFASCDNSGIVNLVCY